MKKIRQFFVLCLFVIFSSCSDEERKFYTDNADNLQQLASTIQSNKLVVDVCCLKDNCFNTQEREQMKSLRLECIRKDTAEGTVSFIIGKRGKKLESTEIVFLYDEKFEEPKNYPNAGILIEKINRHWFIRKYGFD